MFKNKIDRQIIIYTTLVGGIIGSLVKWGSEVNMPPRVPGEISPPGAHIDAWFGWLGFNQHSLDYVYQGASVLGAVTVYHWLFCIAFAGVYVALSYFYPKVRLCFGAVYGLAITVIMHGFLIPLLGFRVPAYGKGETGWLWNLNGYELWSEILGHMIWAISIEVALIAVLAHFNRTIYGKWCIN